MRLENDHPYRLNNDNNQVKDRDIVITLDNDSQRSLYWNDMLVVVKLYATDSQQQFYLLQLAARVAAF